MSIETMGSRPGDWLKHEEASYRSREAVTILAGSGTARELTSGMLLEIGSGTAVGSVTSGNTGGGSISAAPTVSAGAKVGTYNLRCTRASSGAGDFEVRDPDGNVIGIATVAVAFAQGGLAFTISDGSPDFAVGDTATIVVSAIKLIRMQATGSAYGVLVYDVTAAVGTDAAAVAMVRMATLNDTQLTWPSGIAAALKASEKARLAREAGLVFETGL